MAEAMQSRRMDKPLTTAELAEFVQVPLKSCLCQGGRRTRAAGVRQFDRFPFTAPLIRCIMRRRRLGGRAVVRPRTEWPAG